MYSVHAYCTECCINITGVSSWSDKPTMPLLLRFPSRSGRIIKITERMATYNDEIIGFTLLKDDNITSTIRAQFKNEPRPRTRAMEAILQKWLRGPGRTPRSWTTLVDALRETPALSKLVQELEEHFGKSIDVKHLNKGHLNGTLKVSFI